MNFPLQLPCVRVSQPFGDFFLCSIPARVLIEVTFSTKASAKADQNGFLKFFGVQRGLSKDRPAKIGEYIDSNEVTFPNTIILSANFDAADNLESADDEDHPSLRWRVAQRPDGCFMLTIPSEKKLASVIDGQHRLAGFQFASNATRLDMELPCAVFLDLPRAYQANIFATINFNQTRVDRSLAYQLFGYELDESNKDKWPPNLVSLFVARVLNAEATSPFKNHIRLAVADIDTEDQSASQIPPIRSNQPDGNSGAPPILSNWSVSIAAVVEGIEKLISTKQDLDKYKLLSNQVSSRAALQEDPKAPLRSLYLGSEDRKLYFTVESFFRALEEALWRTASADTFAVRTVGILASFDILRLGLARGTIFSDNAYESTIHLLDQARKVDFSDDFFHASGAGRIRIRQVMGVSMGLIKPSEVKDYEFRIKPLLDRYGIKPANSEQSVGAT